MKKLLLFLGLYISGVVAHIEMVIDSRNNSVEYIDHRRSLVAKRFSDQDIYQMHFLYKPDRLVLLQFDAYEAKSAFDELALLFTMQEQFQGQYMILSHSDIDLSTTELSSSSEENHE